MLIHSLFRLNQNTITTINKAHNSNISLGLSRTSFLHLHAVLTISGLSADISIQTDVINIINIVNIVNTPGRKCPLNHNTFQTK